MKFLTITILLAATLTGNKCIQAMNNNHSINIDEVILLQDCLKAIIDNDIQKLKEILKIRKFDINEINPTYGGSLGYQLRNCKALLHLAAELGNLDIVKLLIEHGANVNLNCKWLQISPLAYAVLSDTSNPKVIQELINAGTDVNARYYSNQVTLLHLAAKVLNIPALKILFDQPNINLHVKTQDKNETPLEWVERTDGKSMFIYSKQEALPEQELQDKKKQAIQLFKERDTLKGQLIQYIRNNINLFKSKAINNLPVELREEILG